MKITSAQCGAPLAIAALILCSLATLSRPATAQNNSVPPLTVSALEGELKSPTDATVESVRRWFGADNLKGGNPKPKITERKVAWAIELPAGSPAPEIISEETNFRLPLKRLGTSDVYAAVTELPDSAFLNWNWRIGNETKPGGNLEVYTAPPETKENSNVPKGVVTQMPEWHSKVFADTVRNWWVYVPAQYKADKPACVMVFQDGGGYRGFIPTVFDNMIASGEIPVTIAIFIDPGKIVTGNKSNRSFEYDSLSDQYARMLIEEILPEVGKQYNLRTDPAGTAIGGASSGGICAFTAAWEHPERFGKVLSWIGSYVNLQGGASGIGGGHNYPSLIRKSKDKAKPIRVFLQDGSHDLDNPFGNWPLANQEMAAALKYSGYDYKFVYGNGAHSHSHGRAILPDSLRWLWRDWKETGPK